MKKIKLFLNEINYEMKKVTWPEKKNLRDSTIVVIINILFFAIIIGILDKIFTNLLKLIIK
ncbi:MAG: preprotein translocase subunit SecE [bacterium]